MAKKSRTPHRTPKKDPDWHKFLVTLASTGVVLTACRMTKIPRRTAYDRRDADPEFARLWNEAIELSTESLEEEALRRARDGTEKPVYQQGVLVGKIREYSDTLLIFLLKARKPAVYKDAKLVVAGDPGNPVKHEHSGSVAITDRIDSLSAAFEGAADRAG